MAKGTKEYCTTIHRYSDSNINNIADGYSEVQDDNDNSKAISDGGQYITNQ